MKAAMGLGLARVAECPHHMLVMSATLVVGVLVFLWARRGVDGWSRRRLVLTRICVGVAACLLLLEWWVIWWEF
jgi:hypothetical protein